MASGATIRQVFTVPAAAGEYAPETLDLSDPARTGGRSQSISDVQPDIKALPAGAELEMDTLRGSNPGDSADRDDPTHWSLARKTWGSLGLQDMYPFASQYGVRFRMKSGGTGGEGIIDLGWDGP